MDDIFLPDETESLDEVVEFEKSELSEAPKRPSLGHAPAQGVPAASDHVKITFDRFVQLVANHSFLDVVEKNKDEEVILSTNLLTDLANSRRFAPGTRGPLMILGGILLGILLGYFFF